MSNPINERTFEKAAADLKKLLFSVKLGDVKVQLSGESTIDAKHFKAVVRTDDHSVFSVVTDNYNLITNQQALEWGKEAFHKLFPQIDVKEIKPYRIHSPSTQSFCHIQLIHHKVNFQVFDQDLWLPFIQISNSYNRTYALSFELGFVRKLCNNGVIFKKNTVEIRAVHTRTADFEMKMNVGIEELRKMQDEFVVSMKNLRRFYVDPRYIVPLVCKILKFDFNLQNKDKTEQTLLDDTNYEEPNEDRRQLDELEQVVKRLAARYFSDMGHNAYAVFNIVTDLISNEHENIKKFRQFTLHSTTYYYKPMEWLMDFVDKIEKPDFDMEQYLKDYLKYAA